MADGDPNPNPSRITDAMWWLWQQLHALEPTSRLGGISANKRGYHNTGAANEQHWPDDYSIRDPQDRRGPHWRDRAAAIDWTFPDAQRGDYTRIALYHTRLMTVGRAADPRLAGWREAYGQADHDNKVEGWDFRYHRAVSSDSSHLWHIHLSESREWVSSRANKEAMLSVLRGETLAAYLARGGQLINQDVSTEVTVYLAQRSGDGTVWICTGKSGRPAPDGPTVQRLEGIGVRRIVVPDKDSLLYLIGEVDVPGPDPAAFTAEQLAAVEAAAERGAERAEPGVTVAEMRDAIADLGEGGAAAVRADG